MSFAGKIKGILFAGEGALKWMGIGLLIIGILIHIGLAVYFDFTQDDAFITFRYASNYLNGHGLVYNIGERVEGYTNFLWLIIMTMVKLAGGEFVIFSRIIGILCGIGTIIFTYLIGTIIFGRRSLLPGLCSFLLGSVYSFAYWSVAGLETASFAMAVTASLYFYLRRSYMVAPLLVMATLLRPEGGLVAAIFLFHHVISTRTITRYAITAFAVYCALLAPYLVFKWTYFHSLLPNPFYAKTGFDMRQLSNGLEYAGYFFRHYVGFGLFLIPLIVTFRKWTSAIRTIVLFLVFYLAYITLIGGDVLKVYRFFIPIFPAFIIAIIYGINAIAEERRYIWFGLLVLIGWQLYAPYDHVKTYHYAERALIQKMNITAENLMAVDTTDFSVATSTIGIVGFRLLGHTVIDLLGLTDSTIARHPEIPVKELETTWKEEKYNSEYVLRRQPDYILFSTEFKPSAPAEKALFLYSQFLNSYRTIGFYFGGTLHALYKRYYPIEGLIVRDIDLEFVNRLYDGIMQWYDKRYPEAIGNFKKALELCPEPKFPYLYYYTADAKRQMRDLKTAYFMLNAIVQTDTLVFEAYKDLYIFEYGMLKNTERAEALHKRIEQLAPWYIPRLDSLARMMERISASSP